MAAAHSILRLDTSSSCLEPRRLDTSYDWVEFRRLDTSYGWIHPTADLSSDGWIRVATDSVPWLTWVPSAGYELQLTTSYGWLEFRRLDTTEGWFHPAADYELRLILFCGWLGSTGWTRLAADLHFNISNNFKDSFCKIHHFYGLFSTDWFQLPLIQALAAASRTLKKLEEARRSLKKVQHPNCDWF